MSKICIFGAGAIGGYVGAKLAQSDADVSLIARGPHLQAIRENGLTLIEDNKPQTLDVVATDNAAELGHQDFVVVTLKAHSIGPAVSSMQPLIGPDTSVVFAVNGVPWWHSYGTDTGFGEYRVNSVDPDNVIWDGIGPERAIGSVVYPAAEITSPGIVEHRSGDRICLGEPNGERSERTLALAKLLTAAGLRAPVRPRIRDDIWIKLWGNASFNPLSALTGGTLRQLAEDPGTSSVIAQIMEETQAIGEALGIRFGVPIDKRIAGAAAVGDHRTSMLQDLDMGRTMEIDAIVGAVQELGTLVGKPTPTLDTVLALVKQRAKIAGCY